MLDSKDKENHDYKNYKTSQMFMVQEAILVDLKYRLIFNDEIIKQIRSLFTVHHLKCPRQTDGISCGMFMIANIKRLALDRHFMQKLINGETQPWYYRAIILTF